MLILPRRQPVTRADRSRLLDAPTVVGYALADKSVMALWGGFVTTVNNTRVTVAADSLRLPPCPLPRPGESVAWYEGRVLRSGVLVGCTYDGRPYITASDGLSDPVSSFDRIRVGDPEHPIKPMWRSLPPNGSISRADDQESASLRRLADQTVPGGATAYKLAHEIWMRGFEVFLTGPEVRVTLAGEGGTGAELVTTMPPSRLRQVIVDMYGARQTDGADQAEIDAGELAGRAGKVRVGGQEGTTDPYMIVRSFRQNQPGTTRSIYGASFQQDMAFGDFACNSIYYDLENAVFIDPSGHGLEDAAACCLRPVLDRDRQDPQYLGYIGLQILRQYLLHYTLCAGYEETLLAFLTQGIPAIDRLGLRAALQAEVIDPLRNGQAGNRYSPRQIMEGMQDFFIKFHMKNLWDKYIFPSLGDLDLGDSAQ